MSYYEDDFMQMENSDLVPVGDGRWLDTRTGNMIDESGRIFDSDGNLIDQGFYDDETRT